jgi:hypothetical protein
MCNSLAIDKTGGLCLNKEASKVALEGKEKKGRQVK